MKFFLVLLILGVCNSLSYQDKSSHNNSTREMKNMYLAKQTDQVGQNRDDSSFSVQPSSSYHYPKNDDHLHQNVLSSLNSKIPEANPSGLRASGQSIQVPTDKSNSFSQLRPVVYPNENAQPVQSFGFKPSQFLGYKNSGNPKPAEVFVPQNQDKIAHVNQRPRSGPAQRRNDEDFPDGAYANEEEGQYDSYGVPKTGYEAPEPEYGIPKTENANPETRDGHQESFGLFPGSGPGFVGPAAFDPLPPPPPAIKGSIDYILIPLILIGLAGPIFVVLYVILGAFEAKLSPITTRSLGESYKPYIDSLTSSVSRALETSECLDYAACQFGSLCNQMGYRDDQLLNKYLQPLTPSKYRRHMRKLMASMKQEQECSIQKCLRF